MTKSARRIPQHQRGFTIIELMITIALAAIVTTIGVPSLQTFADNSRLRTDTLDLVQSIHMARSEAIKRGTRVILCRSADPAAANPTCGGSANDWSTGWIVYAAINADDDYDAGVDVLLARRMSTGNRTAIMANGNADNYLEFRRDGTLDEAGAARYAICDGRGEAHGRQVNIPLVGRPAIVKGTPGSPIANCNAPA